MKVALILMSHGHMAEETLKSAEMIVGDTNGVGIVQLEHSHTMDILKNKLEAVIKLHKNKPILIMVDLFGGTPFNIAMILSSKRPNTKVITGFNLGMLIECLTSEYESLDELSCYLCESAKDAIQIAEFNDDDDDIDLEE